jgi:succinoglycan biosynthesis protein ExoA
MNLRITRAGGKVWQSPAIVSWYSPRPNLTSLFRQYFQYGFWKVAVIRKHRIPGSIRHVVPIAFVLANIFLLLGILVSVATGAKPWLWLTGGAWLAMISLYSAVILLASFLAAKERGWFLFPYLPPVFATYHFSYGLGFLAGLRWYFTKPVAGLAGQSMYTRLSR